MEWEAASATGDAHPTACAGRLYQCVGLPDGIAGKPSAGRVGAAHRTMLRDAVKFGLHPDIYRDVSDHELGAVYAILRDRQDQSEPGLGAHPNGRAMAAIDRSAGLIDREIYRAVHQSQARIGDQVHFRYERTGPVPSGMFGDIGTIEPVTRVQAVKLELIVPWYRAFGSATLGPERFEELQPGVPDIGQLIGEPKESDAVVNRLWRAAIDNSLGRSVHVLVRRNGIWRFGVKWLSELTHVISLPGIC